MACFSNGRAEARQFDNWFAAAFVLASVRRRSGERNARSSKHATAACAGNQNATRMLRYMSFLAQVSSEGDDLAAGVRVREPLEDDGGVQAAGVGQHHLLDGLLGGGGKGLDGHAGGGAGRSHRPGAAAHGGAGDSGLVGACGWRSDRGLV